MVSLLTDGAPAIVGKENGLVKRIKEKNAALLPYQCIVHQTALFMKLSDSLNEIIDNLIKLINLLRSRSALQRILTYFNITMFVGKVKVEVIDRF